MDYHGTLCDVCGKTTRWLDDVPETECHIEFFNNTWGYGSKFDMETHELVVCADCYETMPEPWRSKVRRYGRDEWFEDCVGLDSIPKPSQAYWEYQRLKKEHTVMAKARILVMVAREFPDIVLKDDIDELEKALKALEEN